MRVATLHAVLWASTRRLHALTVPVEQGYAVDLGDHVTLTLPEHPDRTLSGLVVDEQLRPGEATIILQVLVGDQG
ncbi:hypothetical protein [Asaia sp. HN010]|uniref:hypothetical protein n=1 Tax=Asaia sp. HN010 TaxID=3081233 RepID=UPI003017CAA1